MAEPRPLLSVGADEPGAEIFVYDHELSLIKRGLGRVELRVEPGLYKLAARLLDGDESRLIEVGSSDMTVTFASAPSHPGQYGAPPREMRTSGEPRDVFAKFRVRRFGLFDSDAIGIAHLELSRPRVSLRPSGDGQLTVFARRAAKIDGRGEPAAWAPPLKARLYSQHAAAGGRPRITVLRWQGAEAQTRGPTAPMVSPHGGTEPTVSCWMAEALGMPAEDYILAYSIDGETWHHQPVPLRDGWRTTVAFDLLDSAAWQATVPEISIQLGRPWEGDDAQLKLTEAIRRLLPRADRHRAEELLELSRRAEGNPLARVLGAYALLPIATSEAPSSERDVAERGARELLDAARREIEGPPLPDIALLDALLERAGSGALERLAPPMLAEGFRRLEAAGLDMRLPSNPIFFESRFHSCRPRAIGPWLAWVGEEPEPEATAHGPTSYRDSEAKLRSWRLAEGTAWDELERSRPRPQFTGSGGSMTDGVGHQRAMLPLVVAEQVREALRDYLEASFSLRPGRFKRALFDFLLGEGGIFKGPYVDVRLPFRKAPEGAEVPLEIAPPFRPYVHQLRAFERLSSRVPGGPRSTLVTTGTGSGKTECFLYPILDHCYRLRGTRGVKAIILYPMNALAADQARRLAGQLWSDPRLKDTVSAGLYVGGKGEHGSPDEQHLCDVRSVLRGSPPDILLTNYKMLDFLLLRPEDSGLWGQNTADTLRYLVLDEMHTYDGAQGSDVACLVRRLKARLGCPKGALACVGTSATLGPGDEGSAALREHAAKIFGEGFDEGSVVREDRLEAEEVLPFDNVTSRLPPEPHGARMVPDGYSDTRAYVLAQTEVWFGERIDDPVALGEKLARHALLRRLLFAFISGPWQLPALCEEVARYEALAPGTSKQGDRSFAELSPREQALCLQSFLAMVAFARRRSESGALEPFLALRAQLWVRELRRLLWRVPASLDEPIELSWEDDLEAGRGGSWLPIVHCRECGEAGWGATQREHEARLRGDSSEVGEALFRRHRSARFVVPGKVGALSGGQLFALHLCPACLSTFAGTGEVCRCGFDRSIAVTISHKLSQSAGEKKARFSAWCPSCESTGQLAVLGARSATISAVALSNVFRSPFNDDKKLLAFSDSVQDASHLAAYYGQSAYRLTMRTALRSTLEAEGDVPLSALARTCLDHWGRSLDRPRLVATLLPPDLRDLDEYRRAMKRGKIPASLLERTHLRLSWEATIELGYSSQIGRSLERTGSATALPCPDRLEAAARTLTLDLVEQRPLGGPLPDELRVERFLEGMLFRLRARGGVHHPFLSPYVEGDGDTYQLRKEKNPLLSPFGREPVPFRFLLAGFEHDAFDPCFSRAESGSWARDWAARALGAPSADPGVNDVYRLALTRLAGAGLLREVITRKGARAFGLAPESLLVTGKTRLARCTVCQAERALGEAWAERARGAPCSRFRCAGELEVGGPPESGYYGRLYRSGRLGRVFSAEHTGLLKRRAREQLEDRFKKGDEADAPNVLACTPTLEMGIDVGDLSAVMLCSAPPTTASYVQRVGRAGRRTGNALVVAMAQARPHDLYFFDQPEAMISGEVAPPGCFLDAPEMLKRQLVAFAMDRWASQGKGQPIPRKVALMLGSVGGSSPLLARATRGFPDSFLAFYRENHPAIVGDFLALFGHYLGESSRERVQRDAQPDDVEARVLGAFEAVWEERRELHRQRERLLKEKQRLSQQIPSDERERDLAEVDAQARVTFRLFDELGGRYPLNVLTDAGVLPNYAFPEPGVQLRSAFRSEKKQGGPAGPGRRSRVQTFEYVRPAGAALRELAPYNTFYADGRRVKIRQIDVGTPQRPLLERYRFCARCPHSEREEGAKGPSGGCPRCGDERWSDGGQVRSLVHFKRALSISDVLASVTADEDDERSRARYEVRDLIDAGPHTWRGARVAPELPFGFELLQNLELREINFGFESWQPSSLHVADRAVSAEPFVVCRDCGRVLQPGAGKAIDHAPYCRAKKGQAERRDEVLLYRRLQSEAIRVLLPVATVGVDEARASFQAALSLGLRRKFRGNPGHILLRTASEPAGDGSGARRTFLVLFDAVPGGTGYLAELWRGDAFLEVLALALDAMVTCPCQREGKDGCYRCVFAFSSQRDLPIISRRKAAQLISEVLRQRHALEAAPTLSEVKLDSRLESELEERFVRALRERTEASGCTWETTIAHGAEAYRIKTPHGRWLLVPQLDLGHAQGVSAPCRPDFVLRPLEQEEGVLPVAIFCDGLAYHVMPGEARGRLEDDLRKRRAILASGRYSVWSLTWRDVEDAKAEAPSFFAEVPLAKVEAAQRAAGGSLPAELRRQGSLSLLVAHLLSPRREGWRGLATALLAAGITPSKSPDAAFLEGLERALLLGPERPASLDGPPSAGAPPLLGYAQAKAHAALCVCWPTEAARTRPPGFEQIRATLRLFDDHPSRSAADFEPSWRAFLQALNLLQFHPGLEIACTEELGAGASPPGEGLREARKSILPPPGDEPFTQLLSLVDASCRPVAELARQLGLPPPEVGLDVTGPRGAVVATAELAWVERKVAVLLDGMVADREAIEREGYRVLWASDGAEAICAAVRGDR